MSQTKQTAPVVSVAMITYNHENFIGEAIESVLMQETGFPIKLVIGEDCSTDKTREIVKRYAAAAGMDATDFAGHSLRSGFATSAAMKGASERSIQNQTGHRSLATLRRYIRDGSLFRENAAAVVGL